MYRKAKRFACQVEKIRERIKTGELVFANCLSNEIVVNAIGRFGIDFRDRIYSPWVTLWLFLNQAMSRSSCQSVVAALLAHRIANGQSACSPKTTSYCEGRSRLPEEFYRSILEETGRQSSARAPARWKFRGREVKPIDGTTVSMPETEKNSAEYPYHDLERAGLSFPLARMLVVFSLSVGTVLEAVVAPYRGKGTGEHSLLRKVRHSLEAGDILLGDTGFCSFAHLAELHEQGVDFVVKLEETRWGNLSLVNKLAKNDQLYRWTKPRNKPETFTREEFKELPHQMLVRVVAVRVQQSGFRVQKFHLITTLVEHRKYPSEELADLYRRRWQAELYLRDIKAALKMDHAKCKTPEMVRKEIYSHLLAYNLIRIQMAEAAQLSGLFAHQISFTSSLNTILQFKHQFHSTDETTLAVMYATIAYHQVGKQPDRAEPRAIKRRPRFSFLTTSRRDFQKCLT